MSTSISSQSTAWHKPLIEFLPLVRSIAAKAFRQLDPAEREEAIQEVIANTTAGLAALAVRRHPHFWLIKPLAKFAVGQWKVGRRVGSSLSKNDVLSDVSRRVASVESLESPIRSGTACWRDVVADSRNTDPAEAACFRIDFDRWLSELPDRHRQVALALADGSSTGEVAGQLRISPGRVSQLRRELELAWEEFQSELGSVIR